MKKRRLADLYVTGIPLVIKDENGEPAEELWLQKPGPIEHETCIRRANAARARVLMHRHDKESEEYLEQYARASDFGNREMLIEYLISRPLNDRRMSEQARLADEEEWSKDDYLQGLHDSWEGDEDSPGLKDEYARDPEHPEAKQVFLEMKRFTDEIDRIMEGEKAALMRDFEHLSMAELTERVTDLLLETRADIAWGRELTMSELFYAIREGDDHKRRYFDKREDLDLVAPEVVRQLNDGYRELTVDPVEGKDSAETGASSSSSEPSATEEPASVSGLLAVGQ